MSTLLKTHRSPSILFQQDYYPKVQPRSSAERDNSLLLLTALKAASTDMAHRLLDYASLDRADCEASCILIALANHDINRLSESNHPKENKEDRPMQEEELLSPIIKESDEVVVQPNQPHIKNDPIMLLVAAAEVVDKNEYHNVKRKRYSNERIRSEEEDYRRDAYPNGRYYRKSDDTPKRVRTTPPTPAPTHRHDTQRENTKSDHGNTKRIQYISHPNTFAHQYHTMKQNPKVKQNALHAYITYMIYNDMAHGQKSHSNSYDDTYTPTMSHHNQYHKQPYTYQQGPDYHYAGDSLMHNNNKNRPRSSLPDSYHPPLKHTNSNTDMSLWYSTPATTPPTSTRTQPPPLDKAILSHPLTAYLWDKPISSNASDRKDIMILPPLLSRPNQHSPSVMVTDRIPPT